MTGSARVLCPAVATKVTEVPIDRCRHGWPGNGPLQGCAAAVIAARSATAERGRSDGPLASAAMIAASSSRGRNHEHDPDDHRERIYAAVVTRAAAAANASRRQSSGKRLWTTAASCSTNEWPSWRWKSQRPSAALAIHESEAGNSPSAADTEAHGYARPTHN